jgi:hypothetical protein
LPGVQGEGGWRERTHERGVWEVGGEISVLHCVAWSWHSVWCTDAALILELSSDHSLSFLGVALVLVLRRVQHLEKKSAYSRERGRRDNSYHEEAYRDVYCLLSSLPHWSKSRV